MINAGFLCESKVLKVLPDCTDVDAARQIVSTKIPYVHVVDKRGVLLGMLSPETIVRLINTSINELSYNKISDIMLPLSRMLKVHVDTPLPKLQEIFLHHPDLEHISVVDNDGVSMGIVLREVAMSMQENEDAVIDDPYEQITSEQLVRWLCENMYSGIMIVDPMYRIRMINDEALRIFGLSRDEALDNRVEMALGQVMAESYGEYIATAPLFQVMKQREPLYNIERATRTGKVILESIVPLIEGNVFMGILVSFVDITEKKNDERMLQFSFNELEEAFSLTLPNSKVEYKLKHTPEYRDVILPDGKIRITEVLYDGLYRHVINGLKIFSDIKHYGVMNWLGIDKDTMVQSYIYHDIGKEQPVLSVGDVVDPREVFEDSRLHAHRSAELARHYCHISDDAYTLIYHHHDQGTESADDFPYRLLPMLRLMQLVDGLSAAMTRRVANIKLGVSGRDILILEHNSNQRYNGARRVNLFTGSVTLEPMDDLEKQIDDDIAPDDIYKIVF
jgi:PAS domain S-box-containing protein